MHGEGCRRLLVNHHLLELVLASNPSRELISFEAFGPPIFFFFFLGGGGLRRLLGDFDAKGRIEPFPTFINLLLVAINR